LFVYDPDTHHALMREAETLPSVVISSQAAANAVMLGGGYFSPLPGFMNLADAIAVAEGMRTTDGLFFPVPILCLLESANGIAGPSGSRCATPTSRAIRCSPSWTSRRSSRSATRRWR
jgi:sulfate adenylyltransferase